MAAIRIETEILIARSPAAVFDYATTAALWHTWHPATAAVRGVADRPLVAGETITEDIAVAGRRNTAVWTVQACTPPEWWEISTDTTEGAARIRYRFTAAAGGTRFLRMLDFHSKRWPWRALDSTLTRWILVRQSATALRNLKRVLERTA